MKQTIVFLKEEEIQNLVTGLAQQINHDYKSEKDSLCLVCFLKGSIFFFSDLIRQLENSVLVDFVSILGSKGNFNFSKDIDMPIKGKNILIVKEILNEGNKLLFLKKRLEASHPKSVKIVTLIDKPSQRELTLQPDYFGMSTEDRYIFGYGLDHHEQYRHLKDMYLFAQ
ncbi:MAG: phosphoribosyltransferase family protein [Bdellovibrionaceae bacterium]|nr:phosphoribosyltransferase family protein [Pseudobdellovibrionaceae bacterium]